MPDQRTVEIANTSPLQYGVPSCATSRSTGDGAAVLRLRHGGSPMGTPSEAAKLGEQGAAPYLHRSLTPGGTRSRVRGHVRLVVIPARVAIQRPGLTRDGEHC
jgi:hypothetical protein